ncbi:MAG: hypothetical protein M0P59_06405 [Gallionella sp.]|jgi:hypothetical protein|nr:hypothetical protein [Gallionella sp.]MCK9353775.1 hypothetical protein [Gallionella sp.]
MLEYIFFDAGLRDSFVAYARSLGLSCELRDDALGLVVALDEDALNDELEDSIEERYGQLEDAQASLLAQEEGGLKQLAGFRVNLPDGQSCQVPLPPELANRLMASFSLEEIQALFDTVARSVLDPHQNLCKILRAET